MPNSHLLKILDYIISNIICNLLKANVALQILQSNLNPKENNDYGYNAY